MKISANVILKAVGLLWSLGMALKDGQLDDEEAAQVGAKLSALIQALEEVL